VEVPLLVLLLLLVLPLLVFPLTEEPPAPLVVSVSLELLIGA